MRIWRLAILAAAVCALASAPGASAATSSVLGGIACATTGDGTRHCGGNTTTVPSFDGVPIDVNVSLPPAPQSGDDGPYPLVMVFHGYGGSKLGFGTLDHWTQQGYAAFSMSDRGFGDTCGSQSATFLTPACATGWVRMMDTRYEVRDAQLFAGMLADEGVAIPDKIASTGGSYGGGMSMALAALKDRTMKMDGSLEAWKSPDGTEMSLAAAAPEIPWTDLAYSLVPNGATLDYVADAPYVGRFGIMKQSFVTGLYGLGLASGGNYAPPGVTTDADLTVWYALLSAGEPYDGNPLATGLLNEVKQHHSSYYIDHSEPPAPLLISNGWTDDLFPPDEALRFYNRTKTQYPDAPVNLFFLDYGHQRGQNKADDVAKLKARQDEWFAYYLAGTGPQPPDRVEALTKTCPKASPSGGPYEATTWAKLAPGEISLDSPAAQTIAPVVPTDVTIGQAFDPITGPGACATASGGDQPGSAIYKLAAAPAGGYTLMGSPTVVADITNSGPSSQIAARLVDVDPGGNETLVARGLFRPDESSSPERQVFQLHADGWKFEEGHVAKLELLPADTPYGRISNLQLPVTLENVSLRLPVLEEPGALDGLVQTPSPKFLPEGYSLAAEFEPDDSGGGGDGGGGGKTRHCHGLKATITGTKKGERITGTKGPDVIVARGGADKINGKGGDDVICGGNGNDRIHGGGGDDELRGDAGNDVLRGDSGDDDLRGGRGHDSIRGGPGHDTIHRRGEN